MSVWREKSANEFILKVGIGNETRSLEWMGSTGVHSQCDKLGDDPSDELRIDLGRCKIKKTPVKNFISFYN